MRHSNANASALLDDFARLFNQFNYEEPSDFSGPEYFIGIMSGTSMDGVDAALIKMERTGMTFVKGVSLDYTDEEKALFHEGAGSCASVQTAGRIGVCYAQKASEAVKRLLRETNLQPQQVKAIGSHGQTLWHAPDEGFSIQVGDSARLAFNTGIDVVSDFRSADIAAGGQGAPLTPLFHRTIFARLKMVRFVMNIGGITNITCLKPDFQIECGFDSGPGNTLIDLVCRKYFNQDFDENAVWASQGNLNKEWLKTLLSHPYFKLKPPKSTGRELFNEEFLSPLLEECTHTQAQCDLLHTLCALTGYSAADAILKLLKTLPQEKMFPKGSLTQLKGRALNTRQVNELLDKHSLDSIGEMVEQLIEQDNQGKNAKSKSKKSSKSKAKNEKVSDYQELCEVLEQQKQPSYVEPYPYVGLPCEVVLCGGGAYNPLVVSYFAERLKKASKLNYCVKILKSSDLRISEKYIEAQAFAYFAYQHVHKGFSDLCKVTGSRQPVFLGAFYPSPDGFHLSTP